MLYNYIFSQLRFLFIGQVVHNYAKVKHIKLIYNIVVDSIKFLNVTALNFVNYAKNVR